MTLIDVSDPSMHVVVTAPGDEALPNIITTTGSISLQQPTGGSITAGGASITTTGASAPSSGFTAK